jgi:hypothetical protein
MKCFMAAVTAGRYFELTLVQGYTISVTSELPDITPDMLLLIKLCSSGATLFRFLQNFISKLYWINDRPSIESPQCY